MTTVEVSTQRSGTPRVQRPLAPDGGTIPGVVLLLGVSGLLPFLAIGVALWFAVPDRQAWLVTLLTAYGAIILSFMGAVHWGLAMVTLNRLRDRWFGLSVLPALVGWFAMMLSPLVGLTVLIGAFAGVYALDAAAVDAGMAPLWYRRLRRSLTLAVVVLLTLGAGAVWLAATDLTGYRV